ncbi:MAG: alpha/beta hydrolase [Armatimonadota bacterium]|jgi:dienelactone hydrolase
MRAKMVPCPDGSEGVIAMTFYENAFDAENGLIQRGIGDRQRLLRAETEDFLRELSLDYDTRRDECWSRDYSSEEAYLASVAPNRERWLRAVGDFGAPAAAMEPLVEPFAENEHFRAEWVTINLHGNLRGRGVFAAPKSGDGPFPTIICQHGIGSSPEKTFGFDDQAGLYHAYAQRALEAGFAVIAPMNITEGPPRARYTRLCLMLGKTLWGLEIAKISRLIDYAQTRPEFDTERLGMWGISLGGAYTSFTMPLEPRIRAGIICAWFNHRLRKMVVDDPRHSCFLSTSEEHIFIPGWLREFTDADLISLICPRPVMAQTGKCDGIAWWPWVEEEFARTREHYERLGIAARCELDLHEGGHEIRVETGLRFMKQWL